MSEPKRFESFDEFWPYYVREHSQKTTRRLHFVGTSLALGCLATAAITRQKRWLLLAPVFGYGGAWIGHFVFEKNKPATFHAPLYSLMGDFVMWSKMIRGTMDEEVERVMRGEATRPAGASATRVDVGAADARVN